MTLGASRPIVLLQANPSGTQEGPGNASVLFVFVGEKEHGSVLSSPAFTARLVLWMPGKLRNLLAHQAHHGFDMISTSSGIPLAFVVRCHPVDSSVYARDPVLVVDVDHGFHSGGFSFLSTSTPRQITAYTVSR